MDVIIRFFLNRTLLVNVVLVFIFGMALAAAASINRNQFPEVDLSTMIVTTQYPGASPRDVEQNVTRLIEDELKTVTGLKSFKSTSAENVSSIVVNIDINYPDQDEIKDEVRRAVDRVSDLPEEVTENPQVRDLKSTEIPIMIVGISGGKDVSYGQLRQTAKIVERDLKRIRGISQIDKYGFQDEEFQVDLDPDKLKDKYVALNDILAAIEQRNVRATGGNLESFRTQRNILTLSQFESIDDVRNVFVRSNFEGGRVKVSDVAEVREGYEDEMMRTIFDGRRGISLVVKKAGTADIIQTTDKIYDYIENKRKALPEGVSLSPVNDSSKEVRNRLSVVTSNAILGFILVVGVLIVFLDLRSSFLIALSIPTSFAITLIILPLTDSDINVVSLAAMIIALGMIVDQSIVVSENAIVFMKRGHSKLEAIRLGTLEVVVPVVASVLTTALAFAPMFVMTGIIGKFVFVIPVVIIASLIGSMINSFVILPNHLSHTLTEEDGKEVADDAPKSWQDRFFERISVPYVKTLPSILRFRYAAIVLAFFLLFFSLWWSGRNVPFNLFPADGADTFYAFIELPDEATFDATEQVIEQIEHYIEEIPREGADKELQYYTARIGTDNADDLAKPVGGSEYLAYLQVTLVPHAARDRDATVIMDELRKKVEDNVKGAKEVRFALRKPGPPAGTPIELRVHGDNDEERKYFVDRMVADLKETEGVSDVATDSRIGREEFKLDIDYNNLARVGLTVQDVASTLRIAFDGIDATSIVRNNEEVIIRVRFPLEHRQDVRNILDLDIRNREGRLIPIKGFASLSRIRAETAIHHTDGDVTTTITAQTDVTTPPQQVINGLIAKYSPELQKYPNVSFSYGGEAEETAESMVSLLFAFVGGVVAIYLVLVLLFNSLSQPIIVLLAIPFGLIGVIWAFYTHGRPFSFLGVIGIIGLSGIVVNNSLMMVEFINKLVKDRGGAGAVKKANELIPEIVAGAERRLRPIVITTITTALGLLPTAYGIGGSDPFIEPMVLAIAWGLLLSTQISLLLIPCFYMVNLDAVIFFRSLWRGTIGPLLSRSSGAALDLVRKQTANLKIPGRS